MATKVFPDFMQIQKMSNWCWTACATSIGLFLKTGTWTQCGTATANIKVTNCYMGMPLDCCQSPSSCNCYGYLTNALTSTKSFNKAVTGRYAGKDLAAQINLGFPVCARIAWTGGGAHFVALTGYSYPDSDPAKVTVYVQDPATGSTSMLLSDFPARYRMGGTWTDTYLTKK